jgi:hypothetical protein
MASTSPTSGGVKEDATVADTAADHEAAAAVNKLGSIMSVTGR